MERLGIYTERHAYCPHLTLARFKREPGSVEHLLAEYRQAIFGSFQVDEFVLFESQLGPAGSVYTVLERYLLYRPAIISKKRLMCRGTERLCPMPLTE